MDGSKSDHPSEHAKPTMNAKRAQIRFDAERAMALDLVRATEVAALHAIKWLGKGQKNKADGAACDAMEGMFQLIDLCGTVTISEGVKDEAPRFNRGHKLGQWRPGSPVFHIAIDPIDGTTNLANGLPNSISVLCAASPVTGDHQALRHIQSFYSDKIAYGPRVKEYTLHKGTKKIRLENAVRENLDIVAQALNKRVSNLTVVVLNRDRHRSLIDNIRETGATLRLISDGDVTAAIAPSMPDSGVDLYVGIGGSPEGVIAAAAIKCLGGEMQMKMWPRDGHELKDLMKTISLKELDRIFYSDDLAQGNNVLFCATGITDSALVEGIRFSNDSAVTHSILIRAKHKTVRYIKAIHNLQKKRIRLSSDGLEHAL